MLTSGRKTIVLTCLLVLGSIQGLSARTITNIVVTPSNKGAGEHTIYTVTLTSSQDILSNDRFVFQFPIGFDASGVVVASAISGMDGGLVVTSATNSQIILTRDNTGSVVLAGNAVTIRFGTVQNHTTAASSYTITVAHEDNAGTITKDTGTSNPFEITHNSLDHFQVTATDGGLIGSQTAGQPFNIRIVAQDAYNNTVVSFNGTVTLDDQTGTIAPTTSNAFSAGVLASQTVTITEALSGNKITASSGSKSGASNSFTVNPAALNHFAISSIASPQTAGTGFPVTITAEDAFGNTVTSFNGTVSISVSSGTVSPTTSGSFLNGTRTESITVFTAGSNLTITVDDGASHIGTSNAFDVQPGALHHFAVTSTSDGNIPDQTAGSAFNIKIVAQDLYNNTVTGFNGTVSLSDPTGTLNPSTSSNFVSGVLASQAVSITKAASNVSITASSGGKTGTSNTFSVFPNALDHFALSSIASPQVAGSAFPLTITAQDAYGNTVTGFTGTVTLSLNSGTLAPTTSGAFSSGVRTESVTVLSSGNGKVITVDDGAGHTGSSGAFDVNPGPLDHFVITATDGSNISDQKVGESFSIRIEARDAWDNVVTGFTGPVNLSDDTGTLTPVLSGSFTAGILASQTVTISKATTSTRITAQASGKSGSSNAFAVTQGSIHHIVLRTAPNNGGEEFGDYQMTADDSVTIYAAGYDIGNTYLGDVSVTWSSTGGLAPAASGSGSSFTFRPTTASPGGTSGTIIGTHQTAGSDATGTITVTPGVPSGTLTLTATPAVLPADGNSTATITSSIVTDADGNAVGAGRQFTIIEPTIGTIPDSQDVNPALPGIQIRTNVNSQLSFLFVAGTVGGEATISVASVNGAATGKTRVVVGNVRINAINAPARVTRGQTDALISMAVENIGSTQINLVSAALRFTGTGGTNRNADYPNIDRVDTVTVIPTNSVRNLLFRVDVSSTATIDTITIDGTVNAMVNGTAVSDTAADQKGKWVVQKPADLIVESVSGPDSVAQGQRNIDVGVRIANNKGDSQSADALIDSIVVFFRRGAQDVSAQYIVNEDGANPDTLAGGASRVFHFAVNVGAAADTGAIILDARVYGKDRNTATPTQDVNGADTTHTWVVSPAAALQIVSLTPSQPTVTQGTTRAWTVNMAVANNSSSSIQLDLSATATYVRFFSGTDNISAEYTVVQPTALKGGGTVLGPTTTDTLQFTITKTGTTIGTIIITGHVKGVDLGPGIPIEDDTNDGGKGQVIVQTPADLRIERILLSQSTVTQNQTRPWNIEVVVRNQGGSDVRVVFQKDSTFISLFDTVGYHIISPTQLTGGASGAILPGFGTATLLYRVDTTGSKLGQNLVAARVAGYEINTGRFLKDSTGTANDTVFVVQMPPLLRIDSLFVDRVSAPNAPFVNTGQLYRLHAVISNLGQEQVDSLKIAVASDGGSAIGAQRPAFASIGGGDTVLVAVEVVTSDSERVELFQTTIAAAVGHNTGKPAPVTSSIDSIEQVTVQKPAALQLLQVTTQDTAVSANQISPWTIFVVVRDTGRAGIVFEPKPQDIIFKMNNQVRNDFEVSAPTRLKSRPGLVLPGGQQDTLVYTVNRTGKQGGKATIVASIRARDQNSGRLLAATDSGEIAIETSAFVRIIDTTPMVFNLVSQDIGKVNPGQVFNIRVVVENPGLEAVETVVVQLSSNGASTIQTPIDTIANIAAQNTDTLFFSVTAANTPNATGEDFRSQILAATASQSGKPAPIRQASDDFARILIERPAQLQILASSDPNDGQLAINQQFQVQATVENLGEALVDTSGQLALILPANYSASDPLLRDFQVGRPVIWQVLAPGFRSGPDTILVRMVRMPLDVNVNMPAQVVALDDTVIVSTDTTRLAVDSLYVSAPAGARDDTVSTDQLFTVTAEIGRTPNIPQVTVTLSLPTGFRFRFGPDDSSRILARGQTQASWQIQAPAHPTNSADTFRVHVEGRDAKQNRVTASAARAVVTVLRAQLRVSATIIGPPGAEGGNLARGQHFVLRAFLENQGTAATVGPAELELLPGETGVVALDTLIRQVQVGGFVDWTLRAPDSISSQKPLIVRIHRTPSDENTNQTAAWVQNGRASLLVATRDRGSIQAGSLQVVRPVGATDRTISTNQKLLVGTTVTWQNARDTQAELFLPPGYDVDAKIKRPQSSDVQGNEFLTWELTAPKSRQTSQLYVVVRGRDAADTTQLRAQTDTLRLTVVQQASLALSAQIIEPESAQDGIVSVDQQFTLRATISNLGEAGVTGDDSLRLTLPGGYTTPDPEIQSSSGGIVEWRVRAPSTPHTDLRTIKISVLKNPLDENSEEMVIIQPSEVQLSILTERSRVQLEAVNFARQPTVVVGQNDVPLLKLKFENTGSPGSSNILLKQITFDVVDREGNPIQSSEVFAALKITRESDNHLFAQKAGTPGASEVSLNFIEDAVLEPQNPVVFVISADIALSVSQRAFDLRLSGADRIVAIDQDSRNPVQVEAPSTNGTAVIASGKTVVLDRDASETAFFNRPNPFGTPDQPVTFFTYFLDKDSDVRLRIYTLFGELVWERTFTATDPEGRATGGPKTIRWDGVNGAGLQVLNGVYLAVLTTNGGTFTTKVAVFR